MKILALEPYYGGSHKAFLDGWKSRSRHDWTLLTLPPNKWKWRMRHSAITLSQQVREHGGEFDLVFCSDMLNFSDFRGLAPREIAALPSIAYFHENQLSYPVVNESEFDYHFAFSNMTTALAADRVWFNSAFHRDSFLTELTSFLKRMPDYQPLGDVEVIRGKCDIRPPGIEDIPARGERKPGPLRILWAARWEYDKGPDAFFRALRKLARKHVPFELSVIGGNGGRDPMPVFEEARKKFDYQIVRWGYLETRNEYVEALLDADVAVSTADHEFFGIGMVEAALAGAYPLMPKRLAYPEVFAEIDPNCDTFFYDDQPAALVDKLSELAANVDEGKLWPIDSQTMLNSVSRFNWKNLVPAWDDELENLV